MASQNSMSKQMMPAKQGVALGRGDFASPARLFTTKQQRFIDYDNH